MEEEIGNIQENGNEESTLIVSNEESCCGGICDPNRLCFKSIVMLMLCFLGFGSYFCYDNPAALQNYIEKDLNLTVTEYTLLYSLYSWPNVVLNFIGGFLLDSVFGIRLGTNIYMFLTFLGQLCFSSGVWFRSFWIMALGRFIFGIGAESLAVAQNNYAVVWFKEDLLNMAFGLQLSFARVGSTVNFMVMESVYNWVQTKVSGVDGLAITLYLATLTCVFSLICSLILGLMHKKAENSLQTENSTPAAPVRLTDVKNFDGRFWFITLIIVFYYVAIFTFIMVGKSFFMEMFKLNEQDSNFLCSIVYLISGIASPILGLFIDKVGRNMYWIILGILFTISAHSLLAFSKLNPYVAMSIMGISYSILASSLWPLVSLILPDHQLGTAYGVCGAVQNLGLAIFTIVVGSIVNTWSYFILELFFIGSLIVALHAAIILYIWDRYKSGILNMKPSDRALYQQRIL